MTSNDTLAGRVHVPTVRWQAVVDWVAASIVTGFLVTMVGLALDGTWGTVTWLPGWLTQTQAVVLSTGFYFVTLGLAGVLVARRYGHGRVDGVLLATFGSTVPFLSWGIIQLPDQQRAALWTALRFNDEVRASIALALAITFAFMAAGFTLGVTVYTLIHRHASPGGSDA